MGSSGSYCCALSIERKRKKPGEGRGPLADKTRGGGNLVSYPCQGSGSGSTPNLLVVNYSTYNARSSEACSPQSHSATPSGIGPSPKRSSPTGAAAGELPGGPRFLAWTAGASLLEHAISRPCIWERGGGGTVGGKGTNTQLRRQRWAQQKEPYGELRRERRP